MTQESGEQLELPFFPLPNFVMFPHVFAPLHVFEPRYRQMVDEVLDADGKFCIGTLVGDWRPSYYEDAPFHVRGCICKVADYEKQSNNRYNIMVQGLESADLREVRSEKLYRKVMAAPVALPGAEKVDPQALVALRQAALEKLRQNDVDAGELEPYLEEMEAANLIDCLGFLLPIDEAVKLDSLVAASYADRLSVLLEGLQTSGENS